MEYPEGLNLHFFLASCCFLSFFEASLLDLVVQFSPWTKETELLVPIRRVKVSVWCPAVASPNPRHRNVVQNVPVQVVFFVFVSNNNDGAGHRRRDGWRRSDRRPDLPIKGELLQQSSFSYHFHFFISFIFKYPWMITPRRDVET